MGLILGFESAAMFGVAGRQENVAIRTWGIMASMIFISSDETELQPSSVKTLSISTLGRYTVQRLHGDNFNYLGIIAKALPDTLVLFKVRT